MGKYKSEEIKSKSVWEKFVLAQSPRSFLQSWNWGETNSSQGFKVVRLGFFDGKSLFAVAQMIHQPAKRGPHYLVPGGPLVDWKERKQVDFVVSEIKKQARDDGAWFVRIRPDLVSESKYLTLFNDLGFKPSPMHLHAESTYIVDIAKSEDQILAGMRKNTRYEVRKGMVEDLTIQISDDPSLSNELYTLQAETVKRNKFVAFSSSYFRSQIEAFAKDDQLKVFVIRDKKVPLVTALIIYYGDRIYYHHSGSSDRARDNHASYRLQWEVIKYGRHKKLKYYDMWGASPEGDTRHRFYGPSLFKKGFGGERVDWIKTHDIVVKRLYFLTRFFELIRARLRHL